MIRTEPGGQLYFSVRGPDGLPRSLQDGATVDVEVLGPSRNDGIPVRIAGRVLVASGAEGFRVGETLSVRVHIADGAVFLHPLVRPGRESASLFAELALPASPLASFIVSFLRTAGLRLDSVRMQLYLRLASRFPGREEDASEAAIILDRSGIEPSVDGIARLLVLIGGEAAGDRGAGGNQDREGDQSLLRSLNRKHSDARQWIIVPFTKELGSRQCSGSIRFLVDRDTKKTIETRVTVMDGIHRWAFILADGTCRFTADPPFTSVSFEKFVVYLKQLLEKSGVQSVAWFVSSGTDNVGIKRIDLEI